MQSQHYNQQNKFNHRISDTNKNKLRTHGSILNIFEILDYYSDDHQMILLTS